MKCCKEKHETFTQCLCHDDGSITCLDCGKVLYNEKHMEWILRGFLSTNTWENIDLLVEQYDLQRDELRSRNLDDYHGDDPTPSDNEVLDNVFEFFTSVSIGEKHKLWDEINQYIKENA